MKKFIIVMLVLAVLVGGGIFGYMKYQESQEPKPAEFSSSAGKIYVKLENFEDSVYFDNNVVGLDSEDSIDNIVWTACMMSQHQCANPMTFIAKKCSIFQDEEKGDTISVYLEFTAENAYGVPGKLTTKADYIKGEMINLIVF